MQTKQLIKAIAFALVLSACGNSKDMTVQAEEPAINLVDQSMMSTLWMQNSFEVKILQEQQYRSAATMLLNNLSAYKGEKRAAVIVDIDETVLDNSPYEARIIKNGLAYSSQSWGEWVSESQAELVPGAMEFFRVVQEADVEVFYISNRSVKHLEPTIENLRRYDLPFADETHVMLKGDDSNKTERREHVKVDFKVLLLVGDQLTDFMEETENFSADIPNVEGLMDSVHKAFVMLPNPMYGSFEQSLYQGKGDLTDQQKDQLRRSALNTKTKK